MTTPPNALIATIGTEINNSNGHLFEALFRSIDPARYGIVALIASPESAEGARNLAERLAWPNDRISIKSLASAHDLDEIFRTVNSYINRFVSMGYPVEQITVNYTSGTKVMSSGAVLSAIYNSCDSLQYITGSGGVNRPQQTLFTRPLSIFAYRDLQRARAHLLARQFGSAEQALKAIDASLLTDYDHGLADNTLELVYAYRAWEANQPGEFLKHYDRVDFKYGELAPFQLREGQHEILEQLTMDFTQRRPSPLMCVEMRNSGVRILLSGDADDAAEHLYRSLEFLSQWKLGLKYQISADNLEIRKVPPRYRTIYEAMRSMDDGKIRIGLRKSFELLALLDDPAGLNFVADARLQASLKRRDFGLLAHGIQPIRFDEAEDFVVASTKFLRMEIENFDSLCPALQFPWLANLGGNLGCNME